MTGCTAPARCSPSVTRVSRSCSVLPVQSIAETWALLAATSTISVQRPKRDIDDLQVHARLDARRAAGLHSSPGRPRTATAAGGGAA
ncbi:hypothetical protein [Novosphingobium lindaniclasticum]|uniref:hypothetical protein n=1 Tax=Novosphingobium lindaniclasticum TaxID=1329895 RepID=UPI0024096838|nr:hypothetical protein [Novosphingobium lindaniclasticum]